MRSIKTLIACSLIVTTMLLSGEAVAQQRAAGGGHVASLQGGAERVYTFLKKYARAEAKAAS